MRNENYCFQYPIERLSETSNNQALIPFYHNIKMKAYMGGGDLYPGVECPSLSQVNSDCVHRDKI